MRPHFGARNGLTITGIQKVVTAGIQRLKGPQGPNSTNIL